MLAYVTQRFRLRTAPDFWLIIDSLPNWSVFTQVPRGRRVEACRRVGPCNTSEKGPCSCVGHVIKQSRSISPILELNLENYYDHSWFITKVLTKRAMLLSDLRCWKIGFFGGFRASRCSLGAECYQKYIDASTHNLPCRQKEAQAHSNLPLCGRAP